jgi:hypothetical protein
LAPPPVAAEAVAGSVTAEDLFGSLDLDATPAAAPLSTDLADEIGRADAAPPHMDFSGFSALAPPMEPVVDRFGAAPSAPALKVVPERKLTAAPSAPEPAASAPPVEESAMDLLEPLIEPEIAAELVAPATATDAEPSSQLSVVAPPPQLSPAPEISGVTNQTQKFGGAVPPVEPKRIPSFAIPPEVPVEPRRSPVAPLRAGGASLGRIALKRVAVNRDGTPVSSPAAAPPEPAPTTPGPTPLAAVAPAVAAPVARVAPAPIAAPPVAREVPAPIAAAASAVVEAAPETDLALPDWMRTASDPAPVIPIIPVGPAAVSAKLDALLGRVETGDLPSGPVLAALFRMLVERGILDEAAVAAALEKL